MTQVSTQSDSSQSQAAPQTCPSVQALEYELAFLVRRLEAVRRQYDFGLERAHYLLLILLEQEDGQSVGCLAQKVNLDASTVTRQIAAMQRCGLVEKQPNPHDRRGGYLVITPKGRAAVEDTRQQRLQHVRHGFRGWDDHERAEFARLLARFSRELSQSLNHPE